MVFVVSNWTSCPSQLEKSALGLEVWQSPEGIFLNQGKYAVEILKRFDMLDCKVMATPMDTKLKLLSDETSKVVDTQLKGDSQEACDTIVLSLVVGCSAHTYSVNMDQLM